MSKTQVIQKSNKLERGSIRKIPEPPKNYFSKIIVFQGQKQNSEQPIETLLQKYVFFIFGVIRISSNFLKHIQQGLKKNYGDQLYSASGRTIRQLDWREESYKRLHKKCKRAVPNNGRHIVYLFCSMTLQIIWNQKKNGYNLMLNQL